MLLAYVKSTATQNTHLVGTIFKSWKIQNLKRPSAFKQNQKQRDFQFKSRNEGSGFHRSISYPIEKVNFWKITTIPI